MSTSSGSTKGRCILTGSMKEMKEELLEDEDGLISLEKLDRASPELWPERIPGITDFIAMSDTPIRTPEAEYRNRLSDEDSQELHELSKLTPYALVMEIRNLHDKAYQLGVAEAKEMTRGKYIGIFNNVKKK